MYSWENHLENYGYILDYTYKTMWKTHGFQKMTYKWWVFPQRDRKG